MLRFGDSSTRARRWVNTQGFKLADEEPGFNMPVLPPDITAVHEQDLMEMFSSSVSWLDYVEVALVAAQIDLKQAEQDLEQIQAHEQIKHKDEKNVSTAKAMAFENQSFLDQREEVELIRARANMLQTVYNSLDRRKFIVSRELTRRKYGD